MTVLNLATVTVLINVIMANLTITKSSWTLFSLLHMMLQLTVEEKLALYQKGEKKTSETIYEVNLKTIH